MEACCAAGGQLFYQWFREGKKLSYAKANELFVKRVRLEDQGTYSCQVRSEHGGSALTDTTQVIGESGWWGEVGEVREVREVGGGGGGLVRSAGVRGYDMWGGQGKVGQVGWT